jgi:hypothetical protein
MSNIAEKGNTLSEVSVIDIYSKYYRFPLSFSEVLSQSGKQIK